jgi:hypothetical protein
MLDCRGGLVVSPNADVIRIERAIARIEEMRPALRRRMETLLDALKQQRNVMLGERALGQRVVRRRA